MNRQFIIPSEMNPLRQTGYYLNNISQFKYLEKQTQQNLNKINNIHEYKRGHEANK